MVAHNKLTDTTRAMTIVQTILLYTIAFLFRLLRMVHPIKISGWSMEIDRELARVMNSCLNIVVRYRRWGLIREFIVQGASVDALDPTVVPSHMIEYCRIVDTIAFLQTFTAAASSTSTFAQRS